MNCRGKAGNGFRTKNLRNVASSVTSGFVAATFVFDGKDLSKPVCSTGAVGEGKGLQLPASSLSGIFVGYVGFFEDRRGLRDLLAEDLGLDEPREPDLQFVADELLRWD